MSPHPSSVIQKAKDPANMSDAEKKHVPVIDIEGTPKAGEPFEVTVWVGKELAHPSEAGHHIEFIDLYLDNSFIARCDLTWGFTYPKACFTIMLDNPGTLKAYERCNIHGDWAYSVDVSV
ncbi:MAG: class II SORL domain-containing protein [Actinobacteria bacterium]|nr:class II SORL domain-containing protein [Actinomycetota bacterium]MCL5883709.1 class II SORL domain-containing protein [Actinomycetota bacterium]